MVHLSLPAIIGLVALANSALAIPAFGPPGAGSAAAPVTSVAAPSTTAPAGPKATATGRIVVSDSDIDAAAITDLPPQNPSLVNIPGAPVSAVLSARPDLQDKINAAPAIAQSLQANTTLAKRGPLVSHCASFENTTNFLTL